MNPQVDVRVKGMFARAKDCITWESANRETDQSTTYLGNLIGFKALCLLLFRLPGLFGRTGFMLLRQLRVLKETKEA